MTSYVFEGRSRRPRVHFAETDEEYYHPGRAQASWNHAPQSSSRRRRDRSCSNDCSVSESESGQLASLYREHDRRQIVPPPQPLPSGLKSNHDDEFPSPQQPGRENTDRGSDKASSSSYPGRDGVEESVVDDGQDDMYLRPPSPIGPDLDAYDEFDIIFYQPSTKDGELSELDSITVDTDSAHPEDRDTPGTSTAKRLYMSQYTGNAEPGGNHTVKLTDLVDPKGKKRSLFRWL
ncbi:hypothetical protein EsDP_00000600 [Epichloe bromicola]|uniref:Uncharacterized protein n=1 Tax=Epichloe bromicola TaxID=79588 RepID=A0ABQ0CFF2_9HYPO